MASLVAIDDTAAIPADFRDTAVGELLRYHNLEAPLGEVAKPRLLIGMCMDHRKTLRMPRNFAYVIRTGGATLEHSRFHVSFAIAVGGVAAIAVMGHSQCGMVHLDSKQEAFIDGLTARGGWGAEEARRHFVDKAPGCEIGDAAAFTLEQVRDLRCEYPQVPVAPLFYEVEDNRIYWVADE